MFLLKCFKVVFILIGMRNEIKFAFAEEQVIRKYFQEQQFSKDYFVVTYDPYTNPDLIGNRYVYNETEQIPFLELVSTKFTTILVNTTYEDMHDKNTSLAVASSSAALLNSKHSHIKLDVWLSVQRNISEGYPNGYLSEQCVHLVEVADRANRIYPGTVTTLVFRYDYGWFNRRFIHEEDLKNCRTSILDKSPYKYRILIFLDSLDCDEIKENILERNPVFSQADVILFKEIPSIHLTESGVDAFFPTFQTKLEKCKRYITDAVNRPSVQVAVISTWLANYENYYNNNELWYELTQYWQKLNNWAVATKTPVVLMKAFDTPYETNISLQTTGWWRLENNQYESSNEYKFEEKYEICCNQVNMSSELTVLTNWLKHFSVKMFDVSLVGVWFDPFVKLENNAKYDESEVNSMVRVITSKFSNLLIGPLFESSYINDTTISLIPKTLTIECKKNASKKLEVSMYLPNFLDYERRQRCLLETISVADQLNSNCSGIVKTLILPYLLGPYELSADYIKNNLTNGSKSPTMSLYKLGVQLPISWCEEEFFASFNTLKSPTDLLKTVDIIYLVVDPNENSENMKVDRIIWQVTQRFTRCKQKIAEDLGLNSSSSFVPLVMMTYFRSKPGIYKDLNKLVDFLKFWEAIIEWAKTSNNSVVLLEAIDNPGKSELGERGWWRINSNYIKDLNYKIEPHFFEEKTTIALKLAIEKQNKINSVKEEQSTSLFNQWEFMLAIIAIPVIFSISFITIAIYFIRRYRLQYLSNSEILKFFQGSTQENGETSSENDGVTEKPYNKTMYELSPYSFTLGSVIGQGNFGVVYKSTVNGETAVIKVPRNGCSKEAFKSILNEIKVLSYVGNHDNVVRFLGAFTKSIKKGKVYIAMEYCSGGSLQSYLRSKSVGKILISIYELSQFCWEIASGMEYIAGRNIIHGDLSARNVLLTGDLKCKIGDFGLSRKLYEYSLYIKTNNQEPLPWRWLALESLKRMEFTTMTDVWSFGITVWEIFSAGDVPYPGMVWSSEFVNKIESGIRMDCPVYSSDAIYQKMLDCWNSDPVLRPSFSTLCQFFKTAMQDEYANI